MASRKIRIIGNHGKFCDGFRKNLLSLGYVLVILMRSQNLMKNQVADLDQINKCKTSRMFLMSVALSIWAVWETNSFGTRISQMGLLYGRDWTWQWVHRIG